ncbi:DUF2610 domain-containing protein [Streptomyces sp. NPDC059695]|uniref:DUF2610 domain-containing protein n=1 Tax=Streptomyces sp. NPDC059695 TaxID=3346910 RepID=UPI00368E282C
MRPFTVPCSFGPDRQVPFEVYVGEPTLDAHPLEQQLAWPARERGGTTGQDVMDGFGGPHHPLAVRVRIREHRPHHLRGTPDQLVPDSHGRSPCVGGGGARGKTATVPLA